MIDRHEKLYIIYLLLNPGMLNGGDTAFEHAHCSE